MQNQSPNQPPKSIKQQRLLEIMRDGSWTFVGVIVSLITLGVAIYSIPQAGPIRSGIFEVFFGVPTPTSTFAPTPTLTSTPTLAPTPTLTPTPTTLGLISSYTLNFAERTYVDLDTGHANLNGGVEYEIELDFDRFFFGGNHTWAKTQIVYISDSQASYQGCADGTLIQQDPAFLNQVQQDQTICVATSQGNWATMKIKSDLGGNYITFEVKLFHS